MEKHEVQPFLTSDIEPSTIEEHENERKHVKNSESLLKVDETANSNLKYTLLVICSIIFILGSFTQMKKLFPSELRTYLSPSLSPTSENIDEPAYLSPSLSPTSEDIDEPAYFKDHFLNDDSKNKTRIDSRSRTNSVTYGFLHMAKTGGTTINGYLATHYERVCGNRGYSYDYHSENKIQQQRQERVTSMTLRNQQKQKEKEGTKRELQGSQMRRDFYKDHTMKMIGFHNCDYISDEIGARFWKDYLGDLHRPLELHIPCRDPVDLFLSMCNYLNVEFTCKSDFKEEVNKCVFAGNRFEMKLLKNIDLKCFESPSRLGDYFAYMGERLQKKEVPDEYVHRDSNVARNKTKECLLKQGIEYKQKLVEYIMSSNQHFFEYFQFCEECLKSDNDLLHLK